VRRRCDSIAWFEISNDDSVIVFDQNVFYKALVQLPVPALIKDATPCTLARLFPHHSNF
jgi:hypothetical protein